MQVLGVGTVDLRQRRITRSRIGPGVSGPFALRKRFCGFRKRAGNGLGVKGGRHGEQCERDAKHCRQPPLFRSSQRPPPPIFAQASIRNRPPSKEILLPSSWPSERLSEREPGPIATSGSF